MQRGLDLAAHRRLHVEMLRHNLAWFALLLVVVGAVYRRFSKASWVAALALLLYAIDDARAPTLGWLANRNALIAAVFGVLSFQHYIQWRETSDPRHFVISLVLLVTSLLSGEIGISTACYLGAYALTLDRNGPKKGLIALWPFALTCIIWWALYKLGNFGANNSDLNYIDPVESPLIFLSKLFECFC